MGKLRHDLQKELIMVYYAKQEVMKPPASSSEIFFCSFFLLLYFLHVYALLVPGATNKEKKTEKGWQEHTRRRKDYPVLHQDFRKSPNSFPVHAGLMFASNTEL
jgi:hypothetical protein